MKRLLPKLIGITFALVLVLGGVTNVQAAVTQGQINDLQTRITNTEFTLTQVKTELLKAPASQQTFYAGRIESAEKSLTEMKRIESVIRSSDPATQDTQFKSFNTQAKNVNTQTTEVGKGIGIIDENGNVGFFNIANFKEGTAGALEQVTGKTCSPTNFALCIKDLIEGALRKVAYFILTATAWVLDMAGRFFDLIFTFSVVDIKSRLAGDAITATWKTLRNFANMFFIFILLAAAIRMVLGSGNEAKKMVMGVLIVAILINFSLFFTKLVVDISNSLTIAVYNQVLVANGANSLSEAIQGSLKLGTVYKVTETGDGKGPLDLGEKNLDQILTIMLGGAAFMGIAAFVLFSIAFMFLTRLVVIFFLMILAPLAYATSMLPGKHNQFERWTASLSSQAVFAPLFLLLFYVAIEVTKALNLNTGDGFVVAFTGGEVGVIMNFFVVCIFMMASLIIARQVATEAGGFTAKGFGYADKLRGWTQGKIGRNTVGITSQFVGDKYKGAEARFKNTRIGGALAKVANVATLGGAGKVNRGIKAGIDSGANATFGGGGSYVSTRKAEKDAVTKDKREVAEKQREQEFEEVFARGSGKLGTPKPGEIEALEKAISKRSGKEIEKMGIEKILNPIVLTSLTASQVKSIKDSTEFNPQEIKRILDAREQAWSNKAKSDPASIMKGRSGSEVAKLPKKVLLMDDVIKTFDASTVSQLNKDGEWEQPDRDKIRTKMKAELDTLTNQGTTTGQDYDRLFRAKEWFEKNPSF